MNFFLKYSEYLPIRFLAVFIFVLLASCQGESSMFFSNNDQNISKKIVLGTNWVEINIEPTITVKNQVQYITLALPNANLWGKNKADGVTALVLPDKDTIKIWVDVKTSEGKWLEFRSISIGKTLMFSLVRKESATGEADISIATKIKKVRLKASKDISVDEINWIDITNK